MTLRPYSPDTDADAVYRLYETALGEAWPIPPDLFHLILTGQPDYRPGDHLVAERGGEVVGFVAAQVRRASPPPKPQGGIALVMVHPDRQRQGIGRALHDAALDHLCHEGMFDAQLGAGTSARFWNGVPENLPDAAPFFESCGWELTEVSHDLVRSLHDYETPEYVSRRIGEIGLRIETASPDQTPQILAFEEREFPNWAPFFREAAEAGRFKDLLAAWSSSGRVVGTLDLFAADSPGVERDRLWTALLGESMGGLGAVGVAEAERERGIGLALVARASEILKARDVGYSHIGWTWLLDFYGRLGYMPWRSFKMAWRDL